MWKVRDIGASLSMGLLRTKKHKDAESQHANRLEQHREQVGTFNSGHEQSINQLMELAKQWDKAKDTLLTRGVVVKDPDGLLQPGWFRLDTQESQQSDSLRWDTDSIMEFLGKPVETWKIINEIGGPLIGPTARAAGGIIATRANPAVICGIAILIAIPTTGIVGAVIAGKIERKKIGEMEEEKLRLDKFDSELSSYMRKIRELEGAARHESEMLIRRSGALDSIMTSTGTRLDEAAKAARSLLENMGTAQQTCKRFAELQKEMYESLTASAAE